MIGGLVLRLIASLLLTFLGVAALSAGDYFTVNCHSDFLSREVEFGVFVPEGEAPADGWPVLYLLHGAWGNHTDWPRVTGVRDHAQEHGVMLVFPDGGQFGWYLDSPREPLSQYESFIIEELIPLVDRAFAVRTDRRGRGICGLSMGGHGAVSLAAKHTDLFGSASSLSGVLVLANHESHEIPLRLGPLAENEADWRANSSLDLAERFVGADVRLLFDSGVRDSLVIEDNRQFNERLNALGVPHIYAEHIGTHSWDYWDLHIAEHVGWHAEGFARGRR